MRTQDTIAELCLEYFNKVYLNKVTDLHTINGPKNRAYSKRSARRKLLKKLCEKYNIDYLFILKMLEILPTEQHLKANLKYRDLQKEMSEKDAKRILCREMECNNTSFNCLVKDFIPGEVEYLQGLYESS